MEKLCKESQNGVLHQKPAIVSAKVISENVPDQVPISVSALFHVSSVEIIVGTIIVAAYGAILEYPATFYTYL